jgi:hypothetical protein
MGVAGVAEQGWAVASGLAAPVAGFVSAHRPAPAASAATPASTHISVDFAFISGAYRREGPTSAPPVTWLRRPRTRERPSALYGRFEQCAVGDGMGHPSSDRNRPVARILYIALIAKERLRSEDL